MINLLWGAVFGMLLCLGFMKVPGSVNHDYHAAIDQCEAELPRNQTCVMQFNATPKEQQQ